MKSFIVLLLAVGIQTAAVSEVSQLKVDGTAKPDTELTVEFAATAAFQGTAELTLGGVVSAQQPFHAQSGGNRLSWKLPPYLGGNAYRLRLVSAAGNLMAETGLEIASPCRIAPALALAGVTARPDGIEIALAKTASLASTVSLLLFTEGKLYAAAAIPVANSATGLKFRFPDEFRQIASGRTTKLLVVAANGTNVLEQTIVFPGVRQPLPKPMNYGIFRDGHGLHHPWYMNHRMQYIFDGRPYFPVGGMWCPKTPGNTSATPPNEPPAGTAKRVKLDSEVLDRLLAGGINDVYINLGSWAKPAQIQYFVDLLESRGVCYGWQLGAKNGGEIPAFFITHDRDNPPANWQSHIRTVCRQGKIDFRFSREYKISGFLLLGKNFCRFVSYQDREGQDIRKGIDIDNGKDFRQWREITLALESPLPDGVELTVIPLVAAKMRHANLWDPAIRAEIAAKISWIKTIKWGPHFRFFVDPVVNELNMLNGTENLRQYTPAINRAFLAFLTEKYGSINVLNTAWRASIPDFPTAARLIPFRDRSRFFLADPESGKLYPSRLLESQAWPDYNQMIRKSYADLMDDIAIEIKKIVNLPVINKGVGVVAEDIHISRRYLGCDGLGFEVYLNHGCPQEASGGATVAAAAATPHTIWTVATEAGFSAKPGNGGHAFFPDEATLRRLAGNLYTMGCNGFFFFGAFLPGVWAPHSFYNQPEKIAWLHRIETEFSGRSPAPVADTFLWPTGSTWWWWTDQSRALYNHSRGEIVQSLRLPDGEWAYATLILPETAKRVIVHLPRPPYSLRYAVEVERLLKSGRDVILVGSREDLGAIPAIDKFYTGEQFGFPDGSTAEVLKTFPGTTVLSELSGRPWAIRHGNLTIVSRTPVISPDRNRNLGFLYLRKEFLPQHRNTTTTYGK